MMHKCSTGKLLARAAFMHHEFEGNDALKYHATHEHQYTYTVGQVDRVPALFKQVFYYKLPVKDDGHDERGAPRPVT